MDVRVFLQDKGLLPALEIRNAPSNAWNNKWSKSPNIKWKDINVWKSDINELVKIGEEQVTGYSIRTGKESKLLVVDVDEGTSKDGAKKNGVESFQKWMQENCTPEEIEDINNTLIVTTGSGGKHYYFKYDYKEIIKNSASILADNVDIRAEGGIIVGPGSISQHIINGRNLRYTVNDKNKEVQPLPKSLKMALLVMSKDKKLNSKINKNAHDAEDIKKFDEGKRNDSLMRELARHVNYPQNRNFETLLSLAVGINMLKCKPPLDFEEVEAITKSVLMRYKMPEYFDEKGNVIPSILAKKISDRTHYKQFQKTNYIYNGRYYEEVKEEEHIHNLVKEMLPPNKQRAKTLSEVVTLMKIANTVSESDKQNIINTKSGLLDLDKFEIIKNSHEYFTTFQVPCEYPSKTEYEGSKFQKYINSTFWQGAEDLIQEVLGIGLLPNPKKLQKCIFLLGEGSNGKSVFINLIKALNGDNVSTVPLKDVDSNRFALANMIGKNVNIDADASGTRLEETSNFKKITSGDEVYLERKGKQGTSGVLNNVMYIGLNKMPSTSDKSHGFIRRNIIIPFNTEFVDENDLERARSRGKHVELKDKSLEGDIISNELDLVFSWAIEGLKRMIENDYNFSESNEVARKTDEYKQEINSAYAFYKENCKGQFIYAEVPAKLIYEKYINWCEDNEISTPMSSTGFGSEFAKYYKKKRTSKGVIYYNVTLAIDITIDIKYKG